MGLVTDSALVPFAYHDILFFVAVFSLVFSAAIAFANRMQPASPCSRLCDFYRKHSSTILPAYAILFFTVHGWSIDVVLDWIFMIVVMYLLAKYVRLPALQSGA